MIEMCIMISEKGERREKNSQWRRQMMIREGRQTGGEMHRRGSTESKSEKEEQESKREDTGNKRRRRKSN